MTGPAPTAAAAASGIVVAAFASPAALAGALGRLREGGREIVGIWSPVPFTDGASTGPATGWLMALAGCAGAALFYGFISWTAVAAFPLNAGGRPLYSWPAFLVAPIELGALVAAAAGVAVFLRRARLTRLHDPAFELAELGPAMQDRLVVAVRCAAGDDAAAVIALLARAGALSSRIASP